MANLEYFSDEDVISFTLLDARTVERLQREGDIKLPRKKVDIPKDERWNTKQMSSKLLQGILAGDDISTIANSLMQVIGNNAAAAVRNARTMVTGAENVGRLDSYEDLAEKGVVQKKVWIATADDRTRESHLLLDGEEVDIDKPFSNGLMYPADPSGDPTEVYNCRCSMRDHIVGFRRADGTISLVGVERDTTSHAGKIEEEIAQRGLEKVAEKENFEPVAAFGNTSEISADQFRESASENLTNSEQKELYEELDRYIDSVSGDTERLAELLDKMDDVKWNSADPLYRGIGVEGYDPISEKNTYEELLQSYRNGEPFTMQSLSWSASEDPAMKMAESKGSNQIIYVDTTEGTRDMISIRGITEETEGKWYADNTQEVLATRTDMQFEPYKVEVDGNVAYVYVREMPAEAPAAPAEPVERPRVETQIKGVYKSRSNDTRSEWLQDTLGYSEEEADATLDAIRAYTMEGDVYSKIHNNDPAYSSEIETLNNLIENPNMPVYDGEIYRGLHILDADGISAHDQIQLICESGTWTEGGITSFSSNMAKAKQFSTGGATGHADEGLNVLIRIKNNLSGVPIQHLTGQRPEGEVLISSNVAQNGFNIVSYKFYEKDKELPWSGRVIHSRWCEIVVEE